MRVHPRPGPFFQTPLKIFISAGFFSPSHILLSLWGLPVTLLVHILRQSSPPTEDTMQSLETTQLGLLANVSTRQLGPPFVHNSFVGLFGPDFHYFWAMQMCLQWLSHGATVVRLDSKSTLISHFKYFFSFKLIFRPMTSSSETVDRNLRNYSPNPSPPRRSIKGY